jgi:hypothetical protein
MSRTAIILASCLLIGCSSIERNPAFDADRVALVTPSAIGVRRDVYVSLPTGEQVYRFRTDRVWVADEWVTRPVDVPCAQQRASELGADAVDILEPGKDFTGPSRWSRDTLLRYTRAAM